MKVNERLREIVFEVIENQINANDPPETLLTLERLVNEGYTDFQAKQLMGQAVVREVVDALKNKNPYDEQRYVKNLRNLPKQPQEQAFCGDMPDARRLLLISHSLSGGHRGSATPAYPATRNWSVAFTAFLDIRRPGH